MEVQEEAMGSKENMEILKGKRTKRPRQACPLSLTMASSSSSMAEGGSSAVGVCENSGSFDRATTTSPTNSGEFTDSIGGGGGEEEDMANCLILLAQGQGRNPKLSEPVVPSNKAGSYAYQCKTCYRCFPSFQALGGHRASHKKPKAAGEEKKKLPLVLIRETEDQFDRDSTALSLQIPNRVLPGSNNKSRVHECSICGAEFSSGQALGGHMRRHRTMSMATSSPDESQEVEKSRKFLSLDLNLPATEDDHRQYNSSFASKEQVIIFSPSSLVDCHY